MKSLCIKSSSSKFMKSHYFTVGQIYSYIIHNGEYIMTNDEGNVRTLRDSQFKESFKDIEQVREEKLKELGI